MALKEIDIKSLEKFNPFAKIADDWFLVTAGDENGYNTMTASWGSVGTMWGKSVAVTVIRPQRYTKEFIDKSDYFTVSFLKDGNKDKLSFCGTKSGRDFDKAKETGLVPVFIDNTTTFEQAELVLICKKVFAQDITPDSFLDKTLIDRWYPEKDFHTAYVGEIVKAYQSI